MNPIPNHERIALQFSGGRDSLAVLLLLREWWDKLTVYFLDGGDEYPETLELVEQVSALVPRFVRVPGRVKSTVEAFGWPSDLMAPGVHWPVTTMLEAGHVKLQDRYTCCYLSIMQPLYQRMVADGITLVIRGQKASDPQKAPLESGQVMEGVQFYFPIQDWSDEQVNAYIRSQGVPLPPYYAEGATAAPECMHCTAWLEHGAVPYLRKHHPSVAGEVNRRLAMIRVAVAPHYKRLLEVTNG